MGTYYRRFKAPSKPTVFALLMAASAVALLLPDDVLKPARRMTQLIAYPSWAAHQAQIKATEPLRALARERLSADEQTRLREEKQSLENENVALQQQVTALQQTVEELTFLRQNHLGRQSAVIPAPVISADAAPRRDSLLLGKGELKGVRPGNWVASRLLIQAGSEDGVNQDAPVLARECLIGWVEETATFTSRVVLLSDAYGNRPISVHLAHYPGAGEQPRHVLLDGQIAKFILRGIGSGQMLVADIRREFIEAGVVAVGDLVAADPTDPKLQLEQSLVIGQIVELRHNKDNPLLYDAVVEHRYDPKELSQALVIDTIATSGRR